MEAELRSRLASAAPVAGIVGDNIAWHERPRRGSLPAIVMTLVSPGREYTHSGPDGLDFAWVQFDLWSDSAAALPGLAAALITEMEQARAVDGVQFEPAFLEGAQTPRPDDVGGGDTLYREIIDLRFYHHSTG